jgi:LPXTG-motif cell wall-anchored protein
MMGEDKNNILIFIGAILFSAFLIFLAYCRELYLHLLLEQGLLLPVLFFRL